MAKVAFIGDQHFGISDGKPLFHQFMERVYGEWFFPLMTELGIKQFFQFGDMYDKRKGVDSFSASESKRYFFGPLVTHEMLVEALIGNHDAFFKETIEVNSPDLLLSADYPNNVKLHSEPRTIKIGSTLVDIIPWICRDNQEEIFKFIEASNSEVCFGHFEIDGFAMYKGVDAQHGLSRDLFKKYKQVFSGHYHTRSQDGNIMYVGTPHELTWNDWNDPRGIHVWDSETGELQFYPCPFTLFTKVYYDEDNLVKDPDIKNKFVKLIVENRTDIKKYDAYVNKLHSLGAHDIKIIENFDEFENDNVELDDKIDLDDTPTLLRNYVDAVETDLDKDRLKSELLTLYSEAKALEQ